MVKENPDGNTSSENDPTESSSEDDRNLGKRQKVEEKEGEEESVEREEGEEDEVKEESKEGEENEEKEECEEKEEDEEKEESGEEIEEIKEIEEGEESEEGEECEESEKEESKSSDDEIESDPEEESGDEAEIDEELEDEDESPLDELIFHLRGEEMSFIEERQKELAKAAKQGQDQASSSTAKKPLPMIIIHHSEGELFEKRALEAKEAIEDRVPGIHIYVNPRQKYRLGIFYIRSEDEREYIGLRMEPPFTELVDLDIDNLAWEVSVYMKYH